MHVGVLAEQAPRENRVALTPHGVEVLLGAGHEISVEAGAGTAAGILDQEYAAAGARLASRADAAGADVVVAVVGGAEDVIEKARGGQLHIALFDPIWDPTAVAALAARGADVMALDLVPRVTRAQSMDVLSSMATVAGYEAVLLGARRLPRMFPMLMTAAGTIPAAKVLVLGAGVAGLQAIASARRLGAIVSAYDVRPAALEQIESLGARAVVLADVDTSDSEDAGGYAKAQGEEENRRQRELLTPHVGASDLVISAAAIPGRQSPLLITTAMVETMAAGSVIVDLAAERGGNCEVTVADGEVEHAGVLVLGPTDLASRSAATASQMLSTNVVNLLTYLVVDGHLSLDRDDEIVPAMLVATGGEISNDQVREALDSTRRSM